MEYTKEMLEELVKVPELMGRGETFAVVMGWRAARCVVHFGVEKPGIPKVPPTVLGFPLILTLLAPNTVFALTREEFEPVMTHMGMPECDIKETLKNNPEENV